jgi:hypothetical protein
MSDAPEYDSIDRRPREIIEKERRSADVKTKAAALITTASALTVFFLSCRELMFLLGKLYHYMGWSTMGQVCSDDATGELECGWGNTTAFPAFWITIAIMWPLLRLVVLLPWNPQNEAVIHR